MIALKQLKRLNVMSWIPIVNLCCLGVFAWEKILRTGVFTDKELSWISWRTFLLGIRYFLLRHLFILDFYKFITNDNFVLIGLLDAWLGTIFAVRFFYYDIKKAYKRQVDIKVKMTTCPVCKYEQPEKRTVCWNCGAEILREVDSKTEQKGNCDICGTNDDNP